MKNERQQLAVRMAERIVFWSGSNVTMWSWARNLARAKSLPELRLKREFQGRLIAARLDHGLQHITTTKGLRMKKQTHNAYAG